MYDIVIKGGSIIDGVNTPMYKANIAIKKGNIVKISNEEFQGEKVISAHNCMITPGFIDVSNHSDTYLTLFSMPSQKSLITQGITTIIGGNCGSSLAPLISKTALESIQKWGNIQGVNINWQTLKEFWKVAEQYQTGVNFGTLIGYATLRRGLLDNQDRALVDSEKQIIYKLIEDGFAQGALGVSLGLAFSHMNTVDKTELLGLAQIVKKHHRILTVHLRNDGEHIIQALEEIIDIIKKTQVKTHINHLKILGHKNWKYYPEMVDILNKAQQDKLPITFDVFPYTANNTVAYLLLPNWVAAGGKQVLLENLQNLELRAQIIQEMKENSYDYQRIIVSDTPINKSILGKNILEIAKNQEIGVEEALIELIIASKGQVRIIVEAISENHLQELILREESIVGTDGAGYDDSFIQTRGYEHPRSFGGMTKFLEQYAMTGMIAWEKAIMKITSMPAEVFGLEDRGILRENMKADIVILDPQSIHSPATFQQPTQYSQGIQTIIVNGVVEWDQGEIQTLSGNSIQHTL